MTGPRALPNSQNEHSLLFFPLFSSLLTATLHSLLRPIKQQLSDRPAVLIKDTG
jgi:hypothetical protein